MRLAAARPAVRSAAGLSVRLILAGLILAGLMLVGLAVVPAARAGEIPTFEQVKADYQPSDVALLDRHGEVIHRLRVDPHVRRLDWVTLKDISPALVAATIQAEDRHFYQHGGVDWPALARVAVESLIGDKQRGASTLTMQLAAMLDPALKPKRYKRSYAQKWSQIGVAQQLEEHWSKAQIIEAYFNLAFFRGELHGVGAAAAGLFKKRADGLDEAESFLLASLLRGPNAAVAQVVSRACRLAADMDSGTPCPTIRARAEAMLDNVAIEPDVALAAHVARSLLKTHRPVTSSLDAATQRMASEALFAQLRQLDGRQVQEGAVLVADNRSGEVLAYVSGGPDSHAYYVDGVQAPRQAGSTLKPFLYELALEYRLLTAASLIEDAPANLPTPNGLYVPQNYDHDFKGMVSVRTALGGSLNVPAVKTLMLVGAETFVERLRDLGFAGLTEDGEFYGYSLALGSAEVSLWQLVNAYRTLANGGRYGALALLPASAAGTHGGSRQVADAAATFVVSDMLSDRGARAVTFGLENPLATRYWSAVKTGTSKDMRDNWCIGYSARYTVGVWVGNYNGEPMHDVSGITGATPVWLQVMNHLNAAESAQRRPPPAGAVAREVRFEPAYEPPRREWFLAGTETARVSALPAGGGFPRISYPGDGEIIALDPDIPDTSQQVFFEMSPHDASAEWRLDGQPAGSGWPPAAGEHLLVLQDAQGRELDRVRFVVRGRKTVPLPDAPQPDS